jgi:hypothetical protein
VLNMWRRDHGGVKLSELTTSYLTQRSFETAGTGASPASSHAPKTPWASATCTSTTRAGLPDPGSGTGLRSPRLENACSLHTDQSEGSASAACQGAFLNSSKKNGCRALSARQINHCSTSYRLIVVFR